MRTNRWRTQFLTTTNIKLQLELEIYKKRLRPKLEIYKKNSKMTISYSIGNYQNEKSMNKYY
jgi:hypothetical protein